MTQSLLAVLIVAAAAVWLSRRIYATFAAARSGRFAGSSCGTCSRNPATGKTPVVEIGVGRPPQGSRSAVTPERRSSREAG